MTDSNGPQQPGSPGVPSGASPQQPPRPARPVTPNAARAAQGAPRPTSFYVAIFLTLLLLVSGGLNGVLLLVALLGSAADTLAGTAISVDDSDANYEVVAVGGDQSASKRVLRVPVDGAINEQAAPLLGATGGTVSSIKRHLRLAARDDSIVGVLLDINSPGGGVTASDEIHRVISEFREDTEKPVVALFGDVSASGGYYIAAACDEILARPTTITGSIGVIINTMNYAEALKKLGVSQKPILDERTPHKDMLSPTKAPDEEEIAIVRSIVSEMYERFVDVVDIGRSNLNREQVIALADGRIYSAQQALENGLVDGITDRDEAVEHVLRRSGDDAASVVEYRRRPTFGEALLGAGVRGAVPPTQSALDRVVATLVQGTSGPVFCYFWLGGR